MHHGIEASVAQLIVSSGTFLVRAPYAPPKIQVKYGSAWVVEVKEGEVLLMSNSHVVEGALNVQALFQATDKEQFPGVVVANIPHKDVALVSVKIPSRLKLQPLQFIQNSLTVAPGDHVKVVGFPLGIPTMQINEGIVSGFCQSEQERLGPSSYIQFTATLAPGSSGSALLNNQMQVIGICAAAFIASGSINYAISSNNIRASLEQAKVQILCLPPRIGLSLNRNHAGALINHISPISIFRQTPYEDNLEERRRVALEQLEDKSSESELIMQGDYLRAITIQTISLELRFEFNPFCTTHLNGRTLVLADIEEMINYGSEVKVELTRNGEEMDVVGMFIEQAPIQWMMRTHFPTLEPQRKDYLILGGLVLVQNRIELPQIENLNPFQRHIQVAAVLGGGSFDNFGLKEGDRLLKVNSKLIFALEEIVEILKDARVCQLMFP